MSTPPDYNGQPRDSSGRFSRGEQNKKRRISATAKRPKRELAGAFNAGPYGTPPPTNLNPDGTRRA